MWNEEVPRMVKVLCGTIDPNKRTFIFKSVEDLADTRALK